MGVFYYEKNMKYFIIICITVCLVLGGMLFRANNLYKKINIDLNNAHLMLEDNEKTINKLQIELITTPKIINAVCDDKVDMINKQSDFKQKINKLSNKEVKEYVENQSVPVGVNDILSDDVIRLLKDTYNGL